MTVYAVAQPVEKATCYYEPKIIGFYRSREMAECVVAHNKGNAYGDVKDAYIVPVDIETSIPADGDTDGWEAYNKGRGIRF